MMKILLPACFIALKLTGTFIDFMLGLSNSEIAEEKDFLIAKAVQEEFSLYKNEQNALNSVIQEKFTDQIKSCTLL